MIAATSLAPSACYAPMPSRRPLSLSSRPPLDATLAILAAIEIPDCGCPLEMVPVCKTKGGCERQQRGRRCDCPRWPGAPCKHVLALAERLGVTTPQEAEAFAAVWANLLWETQHEDYRERARPYRATEAIATEARVRLMELRESMGLGLWHPRDVRRPSDGNGIVAGLGRLVGAVKKSSKRKAVTHGT